LQDLVGNAVTPEVAIVVPTATDADGALTEGTLRVVKMDATNVTIRGTAKPITFTLYVG
jgi:hypothetical protein